MKHSKNYYLFKEGTVLIKENVQVTVGWEIINDTAILVGIKMRSTSK